MKILTRLMAPFNNGTEKRLSFNHPNTQERLRENPNYVTLQDYLYEHLTLEDAQELNRFLRHFVNQIPLECAIFAVGSSTFPKEYWEVVRAEKPELETPDNYRNIDLLLHPMRRVDWLQLQNEILSTLRNSAYPSEIPDLTEEYINMFNVENGNDSSKRIIGTALNNGTKVNLRIPRDTHVVTAPEKLEQEIESNRPFSVLHYPE